MRQLFAAVLCCLGCAAPDQQRVAPPPPPAERLAPIREAVRAAQAALAADQIETALPAVRRAEQLIGLLGGTPGAAPALQELEAEMNQRLKPALRERLGAKYWERYGLKHAAQL